MERDSNGNGVAFLEVVNVLGVTLEIATIGVTCVEWGELQKMGVPFCHEEIIMRS